MKKFNMKSIFNSILTTIFITMILSSNVFARKRVYIDRFDIKNRAVEQTLKSVYWEGIVQCSNRSHKKTGRCFLELVRSSDGKIFDIVENKKLVKRHCFKHKNLKVNLSANLTPTFLFFGGKLIVKNFNVLKEVENKSKI